MSRDSSSSSEKFINCDSELSLIGKEILPTGEIPAFDKHYLINYNPCPHEKATR